MKSVKENQDMLHDLDSTFNGCFADFWHVCIVWEHWAIVLFIIINGGTGLCNIIIWFYLVSHSLVCLFSILLWTDAASCPEVIALVSDPTKIHQNTLKFYHLLFRFNNHMSVYLDNWVLLLSQLNIMWVEQKYHIKCQNPKQAKSVFINLTSYQK